MKLSARKLLLGWTTAILLMIALGASYLILTIRDGMEENAARMEAEMLSKSLVSSLNHDLLGGNFMLASRRVASFLDDTTGDSICVQIHDASQHLVVEGGDSRICDKESSQRLEDRIYFDSERKTAAFSVLVAFENRAIPVHLPKSVWFTAIALFSCIVIMVLVLLRTFSNLFQRIHFSIVGGITKSEKNFLSITEELAVKRAVFEMRKKDVEIQSARIRQKEAEINSTIANQVAHDIRSPLSALNMLTSQMSGLNEEHRFLVGKVSKRINEIADDLLKRKRIGNEKGRRVGDRPAERLPITYLLEDLMAEKQFQVFDRSEVELNFEDQTRGTVAFVNLNSKEFSRAFSNLLNNALEARRLEAMKIFVSLSANANLVSIKISDNGKGMSESVIQKLGIDEFSSGKKGTGMGVLHARQTFEAAGGKLTFDSTEGVGTTVTIEIPRSESPLGYVENAEIKLSPRGQFVVVDDDQVILEMWERKFISSGCANLGCSLKLFLSIEEFESWYRDSHHADDLYVVDFHFLHSERSGLDMILQLGIGPQSIVCTTIADSIEFQSELATHQLKFLPKNQILRAQISCKKPESKR